MLLSRNFKTKRVKIKFRNFHTLGRQVPSSLPLNRDKDTPLYLGVLNEERIPIFSKKYQIGITT